MFNDEIFCSQNGDQIVITTQIGHNLSSGDVVRIEGIGDPSFNDSDLLVEVVSDNQFYAGHTGTGGPSPAGFAENRSHLKIIRRADQSSVRYVS